MRPLLVLIGFLFSSHVHAEKTEHLRTLAEAFSHCEINILNEKAIGSYEQVKSTRKVLVSQTDIGSCPSFLLIHRENEEIVAPAVGARIRTIGSNLNADGLQKKETTCSYRLPFNTFSGQTFLLQFSYGNFQCILNDQPAPENLIPSKKRR